MSGNFFLPLKWYTNRKLFGEGWGGEVAENNFPKKNFQVKFENLILSGRFNQTPPPPEASSSRRHWPGKSLPNVMSSQSPLEPINRHFVALILLSIVMFLVPKVDELTLVVVSHNPDIICITETWLKNQIPDDVVQIHNYTLLRRDRKEREHGGVCLYIKNSYSISVLDVPNEHECEVLWAIINSRRLPRGYAKLVIGVLYHPPGANKSLMLEHLQSSLEIMETKYPNCGILLTGDFKGLVSHQEFRRLKLLLILKVICLNTQMTPMFLNKYLIKSIQVPCKMLLLVL